MHHTTGLGVKSLEDENTKKEQYFFSTDLSDGTCIMGVFVGYKGDRVRRFLVENFPKEARILAKGGVTNEDIPLLLCKLFENMDKKVTILLEKPSNNLEDKLECATGVVVLMKEDSLFIANLGSNRALLTSSYDNKPTHIVQLTQEHSTSNPEEIARISSLGIDVSRTQHLCGVPFTRCFGGTGLVAHFSCAVEESPWISRPSISGPFRLDESACMLVVVSKSVMEKVGGGCAREQLNGAVISNIEHQLCIQPCMDDVAQGVLDEVAFFSNDTNAAQKISKFSQDRFHSRLLLLLLNFKQHPVTAHHSTANQLTIDVNCTEQRFENNLMQQLRHSEAGQESVNVTSVNKSTACVPDNNSKRIDAYVDFSGFHDIVTKLPESLKDDYKMLMDFVNAVESP